jgi:hypothetical protein
MALNKSQVTAYVDKKFNTSTYIKKRKITGEKKYYNEEVEFWAEQIINSNWELSVFDTEFDLVYSVDHDKSQSKSKVNDYVGQTFLISKDDYKKGMFVSSISVFMENLDADSPITLELRPLVNGYPGDVLPLGKATFTSNFAINYKWKASVDATDQVSKCDFKFKFPVYLSPGYYCFTLKTNSSNHTVFIAENGAGNIDSGTIVTNPYLGDYIYSGQGESWVIDPNKDLCFIIYQAVFELGSKNLYLNTIDNEPTTKPKRFDYDLINLTTSTMEVSNVAYISSCTTTVNDFYTENPSTLSILPNSNVNLQTHSRLTDTETLPFTITLTNTDSNLTPIVDLNATGICLTKNLIDPYDIAISNSELSATEGTAHAKYATKAITLNDEFDANGISVYIDVNKPSGTNIEIFYRILNRYDYSIEFKDSPWYRLPKKSNAVPALISVDYAEESYEQLNIEYVGANGVNYNSFNQLAIKVVFYSDEPSRVPLIKNLRVIATV